MAGLTPSFSAVSVAGSFLASEDLVATALPDSVVHIVPVVLDGFRAVRAGRASDGPAKQTNSPVASINAARPLALIAIGDLPICQSLTRKETRGVSTAGQKKGIFALHRAKAGQCACAARSRAALPSAKSFWNQWRRCQPKRIDVMSLWRACAGRPMRPSRGADHDFVIGISRRNKLKDRPNCNVGACVREREDEWTGLMRSAIAGDSAAYHRLLKAITPVLRAAARRGLARAGQPVDQSEDIVQDILLAVHLKRHTWDANAPFAPWLFAIARNKLIDALRRRGRRIFVNIDDFAETLPGQPAAETASGERGRGPARSAAGAAARGAAIDRGRKRIDQGYGGEICDERGRGAGGAASRAREPHRQTAGTMRMDTDQLIRTLAADNPTRPAGRLRAGAGAACRRAGVAV